MLWADMNAHASFGVPLVRMQIDLPGIPGTAHVSGALAYGTIQRRLFEKMERRWKEVSNESGHRVGRGQIGRLWRNIRPTIPTIALWPAWAIGLEPNNEADRMFEFLPLPNIDVNTLMMAPRNENSRPLLIFLAGTQGTTKFWGEKFFQISRAIAGNLDCDALLLGGSAPIIPITSEREIWKKFAPLKEVLRHAAAVIHHGGIGTAAAAIESGVPQLIVPRVFGQPSNAEWMRRLGVCDVIQPKQYSVSQVTPALRALMTEPRYRQRSVELSGQFRRSAELSRLCDFIEGGKFRKFASAAA